MTMPNFFILGGPKTATTAISQYLSEHPQVLMSKPKEPHYFNTDHNYRHFKSMVEYERLFDGAHEKHSVIGEASVWYLYSKDAVRNIEGAISRPKYLIMLRNPVDMAHSLHEQMIYSGSEQVRDFGTAWKLQDERRHGRKSPMMNVDPKRLLYKDICSLGEQLQDVYSCVERDRVHLIFNEDLCTNPRRAWLNLLDFLKVEDNGRREFPRVNEAKTRRSQLISKAVMVFGIVRKRLNIKPLGTGLQTNLEKLNTRTRARKPIPTELRNTIRAAFDDDIQILAKLTGRDLSHWR